MCYRPQVIIFMLETSNRNILYTFCAINYGLKGWKGKICFIKSNKIDVFLYSKRENKQSLNDRHFWMKTDMDLGFFALVCI